MESAECALWFYSNHVNKYYFSAFNHLAFEKHPQNKSEYCFEHFRTVIIPLVCFGLIFLVCAL